MVWRASYLIYKNICIKSDHLRELVLFRTNCLLLRVFKHWRFHVPTVWVLQNIHKWWRIPRVSSQPLSRSWCVYWPSSWACRCESGLHPGRICVGVSGLSLWPPSSFRRCWSTAEHHEPRTSWDQESGKETEEMLWPLHQWWDVVNCIYMNNNLSCNSIFLFQCILNRSVELLTPLQIICEQKLLVNKLRIYLKTHRV